MKLRKSIISFLLIFAYSLGFAQEFIPHIHVEDGGHNHLEVSAKEHHHLENHTHTNSHNGNDVAHQDHLDESIYDYLICLMSGVEHSACYASHAVSFPSVDLKKSESKRDNFNLDLTTSSTIFTAEFAESKLTFTNPIERRVLRSIADSDPNRGPPSIPC